MSRFASISILLAAGIGGPAGCFLASPQLLPLPALLPVAGTLRWGWRWLLRLLAAVAAPGAAAALFAAAGRSDSATASLRWALSLCCGIYMATDAGALPLAWWFDRAAGRLGRLGSPLGQISGTLALGQLFLAELRRLSSGPVEGEGRASRVLRLADRAFASLPEEAPPVPEPPAPSVPRLAAATAVWIFGLAGLAGL